ncbi:hypothetical protein ACR820_01460 [Streptomyces netropsis]
MNFCPQRAHTERRLNAYAEYAHTVKELSIRYTQLAIARGVTTGSTSLEPTDGVLEELAAAKAHRSALAETLWLLGDVDSNTAAVKLNHALWHLEWLARGIPTTGIATWPEAYLDFRKARKDFPQAARCDLGVPGARIAHDVPWPPPWRPSNHTGAGEPRSGGLTRFSVVQVEVIKIVDRAGSTARKSMPLRAWRIAASAFACPSASSATGRADSSTSRGQRAPDHQP